MKVTCPLGVNLHDHLRQELGKGLKDNTLLQYLALPLFLMLACLPCDNDVT